MLLLTFKAGPNLYAIEAAQVVELVPRVTLRSIPHAPEVLAGLLSYRGRIVPVIDLGLLLGRAACPDRLSTRIILVKKTPGDENCGKPDGSRSVHDGDPLPHGPAQGPSLLGLIAEEVSDLASVESEQLRPAPVGFPQAPYLGAIVQTDRGILQVLIIEKVRDTVLRDGVSGQETAVNPESVAEECRMWDFKARESETLESGDESGGDA
jgi:chemotaxis-related protein WspB